MTLANSTLHYVNYFENEITEAGLSEDFNEWQQIAYNLGRVIGIDSKENETVELTKKFENKMNDILSKL